MSSLPPESARLFMAQLGTGVRREDIQSLFEPFGKILEIRLLRTFGFVEFDSPEHASAALKGCDGTDLKGVKLVLQFANGSQNRRTRRLAPASETVKDLGRSYGHVVFADIDPVRADEGIIEFKSRSEMETALRALDGYDFQGRRLRADPAEGPAPPLPPMGGSGSGSGSGSEFGPGPGLGAGAAAGAGPSAGALPPKRPERWRAPLPEYTDRTRYNDRYHDPYSRDRFADRRGDRYDDRYTDDRYADRHDNRYADRRRREERYHRPRSVPREERDRRERRHSSPFGSGERGGHDDRARRAARSPSPSRRDHDVRYYRAESYRAVPRDERYRDEREIRERFHDERGHRRHNERGDWFYSERSDRRRPQRPSDPYVRREEHEGQRDVRSSPGDQDGGIALPAPESTLEAVEQSIPEDALDPLDDDR